jgi:citronellol/citronellal dehydrogenase
MFQSIFKDNIFKDEVVLITGGGSGIGRVTAFEFSTLSAIVIITGRNIKNLQETTTEIQLKVPNSKIEYHQMDIRNKQQTDKVISTILKKHAKINILINNAGGQFASPAAMISDKGWRAVIDTNLNGTWNVIRSVFDQTMQDNGGTIVSVIADIWCGFPMMAHTSASRAAIENLTKTLALEWACSKIRLNCVAPGLVIGNGMNNYPDEIRDQVFEDISWKNPIGRMATEDEISAAIVFLSSPAAAYINGTTLKVDGGGSLAKSYDELFSKDSHAKAFFGMEPTYSNPKLKAMLDSLSRYKAKY